MLEHMRFQRVFSKAIYKNLKLPLAEMTFFKDFVSDRRGDLYPLIEKSADCDEHIHDNVYHLHHGSAVRMFTRFFPYATYELSASLCGGRCGFSFRLPNARADITCDGSTIFFSDTADVFSVPYCGGETFTLIISCRPGAFDLYHMQNGSAVYLHTFRDERFANAHFQQTLDCAYVCLIAEGSLCVTDVSSYLDCGISQADFRAICYENGDPMYENGKIYYSASIRLQEGAFQGIFAWVPSTSHIELSGAIFFDCGDGYLRNYLASSIVYDRHAKCWYVWTSACRHKHILCSGTFRADPRFGVSVVDVCSMEPAQDNNITAFAGFVGDEDPDLFYHQEEGCWYLAICRLCPLTKRYRYVFFRSDDPMKGFVYLGQGYPGHETGGSFVRIADEVVFICGNEAENCSNYRIYSKNGMTEAEFDFPDGGFRGWGTVIPVEMGSRKRYFWLTFDRHNGSSFQWSYGNLYCFEAVFSPKSLP